MKRKTLIVLLAAGALALASIGGVLIVNADSGSGKEGIRERAAEILGVETSDLQDALAQAHQEAVDAKIEALIDSAVEDGTSRKVKQPRFETGWPTNPNWPR